MEGCPTRKTGARRVLAGILASLALLASSSAPCGTARLDQGTLQDLGARIKLASDRVDAGIAVDHEQLVQFERIVATLRGAHENDSNPGLNEKLAAVERLLERLKSAHRPLSPGAHPATPSRSWLAPTAAALRASLDLETVTSKHGADCSTALGLSVSTPVQLLLSAVEEGRSDAWFRFEPPHSGHFRFATDSGGSDPALAIFASCSDGASALAENDDSMGLDAALVVEGNVSQPLLVLLKNSGSAGTIVVSVQDLNASISGKVTDLVSGLPIGNAPISLYDNGGGIYWPGISTDASGAYSVAVDPGSYYVRASAYQHVSELYPDAPCRYNSYNLSDCNTGQAQLVTVGSGASVTGIDLALDPGHKIGGVIRDGSNNPIQGNVTLYDGSGSQLGGGYSDGFGRYYFSALPAGGYKVSALANGYGSQVFDHIACSGPTQTQCSVAQATIITLAGQDVIDVNFNLPKLATIEGFVTDSDSQALNNYTSVNVLDNKGVFVGNSFTDSSGHYRVGPLGTGSYYAYAVSTGFFSKIFDGVNCSQQDCSGSIGAATALVITQAGQLIPADFKLEPLPVVHGHVQDAVSGLPLANVSIYASPTPPANFNSVSGTVTSANGDYFLFDTPPGTYYLWAQSNDHVDQIYPGIICEASSYYATCDVTGAVLLTIAYGQGPADFNFTLQPGSKITGKTITRAGPGSDLPASTQVSVSNGAGVAVATASSDAQGNYVIDDLAPGTYYAVGGDYYSFYPYMQQLWQSIDCPAACVPTTGTPITLAQHAVASGIDFSLIRRNAIVGRVTDTFGSPIGGALIDLFDASTAEYRASGATDAAGYYAASWNSGYAYFIATEADGYIDQVHSGIACPLGPAYFGACGFANATSVTVSYANTQPLIVNFSLKARELIFSNGFE